MAMKCTIAAATIREIQSLQPRMISTMFASRYRLMRW